MDYAGLNLILIDLNSVISGAELSRVSVNLEKHHKVIKSLNHRYIQILHSILRQGVMSLLGENDDPLYLSGSAIQGEESIPHWIEENNGAALAVFYSCRLIIRSIYGEYLMALEDCKKFRKYKDSMKGVSIHRNFTIIEIISRLVLYPDLSLFQKIVYRAHIIFRLYFVKRWTRYSPHNISHSYHTIKALYAWKITKDISQAKKEFKIAISLCHKVNDSIMEVQALEFQALFYDSIGYRETAKGHLQSAYHCCSNWGAMGKLKQMKEKYPHFLDELVSETEF